MTYRIVSILFLLSAWSGFAQTSAPPATLLSPRALMPVAPIFSSDRLICVRSSIGMAGYRTPVLLFTDNTRSEFFRATRLVFPTPPAQLEILIGNKRDGDKQVLSSRFRLSDKDVVERIELPDPEAADLALFRRAIWLALYRSWLVSSSEGNENILTKLPSWLAEGAIRKMDKTTWAADIDRILWLWSHAALPPAQELLLIKNGAISEPAIGTVLVAYLSERKSSEGKTPFDTLLKNASAGNDWSIEKIAGAITGTTNLQHLDEDLDLWLLSLSKKVVLLGMTSEGVLQRFRSSLLIYPSDYGKVFNSKKPYITFQELLETKDDPVLRKAALVQARRIGMAAIGRDATLTGLAERYMAFLEAYAAGKQKPDLAQLLAVAEAQRKEVEQAVQAGKTLRSE
jgi:hypothetical protein